MRMVAALFAAFVFVLILALSEADPVFGAKPLDGQEIFRFDTFGDEQLWTDTRLHEAVQTVTPRRRQPGRSTPASLHAERRSSTPSDVARRATSRPRTRMFCSGPDPRVPVLHNAAEVGADPAYATRSPLKPSAAASTGAPPERGPASRSGG
jgi:hypothetical protein